MARVAQIQRRLRDANVRLDADEGDARARREAGGDGGDEHGELGLVVDFGDAEHVDNGGDGGAQLGGGLGGCVDGDGEVLGVGEELDGGGDAVIIFGALSAKIENLRLG